MQAQPPPPEKLSLWAGQAPIGDGTFEAVEVPITVYLADPAKANGAAIVLCAGGGYGGLVIDAEGHNIAKWLNQHGIADIVLEYLLSIWNWPPATTHSTPPGARCGILSAPGCSHGLAHKI